MWRRNILALALIVALAACEPGGRQGASEVPSPFAGESPDGLDGLPPGCHPINLRATDGARVELDGTWTDEADDVPVPMTWYIRTQGDCFWATGSVADPESDFSGYTADVQIITGRIGTDFLIDAENVRLGPPASYIPESIYSAMRLIIQFEADGEIVLREDRTLGVLGPRCISSTFCLPVLLLHRSP